MSDLLVLCYHAVSDRWPADLSITPERLEDQLGLLVERGYRSATFSEALGAAPPQAKTLVVTFDDAFRSVAEHALPIMDALGMVGTVFAVTGFIGSQEAMAWPGTDQWIGTEHERELRAIGPDGIERLVAAGWEVGSHTVSHPRLTSLDDAALEHELRRSREDCERLVGRPCASLAYPYGDVDERVVRAAGQAGYRFAGALSSRLRRSRPLEWPRVGIYYGDSGRRFRAKVSPAMRRLRSTPAWDVADRLRWAIRR